MMKRIFSLLFVAVACSAAALAQSSLVATLTHGSTISAYYGTSALKEAYAAAATGDVITLSSGEFEAVDIEKAITVRGAGVILANDHPTTLLGSFYVNIPVGTSSLTLEGLQCMSEVGVYSTYDKNTMGDKVTSANIYKCYFLRRVNCANSTPFFMHCVFWDNISVLLAGMVPIANIDGTYNTIVTCMECVSFGAGTHGINGNNNAAIIHMKNCILNDGAFGYLDYSTFDNCIFTCANGSWFNPTANFLSNSLCVGVSYNEQYNSTNTIIDADFSTIFKTFNRGSYNLLETFELTDEAKAKYKGSDGTQVGIYGGTNPFDPTPTNPQIKKFGVSTSNTDGKLNVKINVE